eukprot:RCo021277
MRDEQLLPLLALWGFGEREQTGWERLSLVGLHLQENCLSDHGLRTLGMLSQEKELFLDLSQNQDITCNGLSSLLNTLAASTTLRRICLRVLNLPQLTQSGSVVFPHLRTCPSLQSVRVELDAQAMGQLLDG